MDFEAYLAQSLGDRLRGSTSRLETPRERVDPIQHTAVAARLGLA